MARHGVIDWFVLVPISVAAVSLAMLLTADLNAAAASVTILAGVRVSFGAVGGWGCRHLFRGRSAQTTAGSAASGSTPATPSRRP